MKTKVTFFFACLIACCNFGGAQTNVSGFISSNTTWNLAGSPYIVTGNVLLDSGYCLTVEPGVIIKFNSGKSLQIGGVLKAIGTAGNMISFTSNQSSPAMDDWDYIYFINTSMDYNYTTDTGCIMKYCIVEYAGGAPVTYNAAIRIDQSFPFISDCIIHDNGASGINGCSNDPGNGTFKVLNCEIYNNDGVIEGGNCLSAGITINLNTSVAIISGNYIHDNINNGEAAAIYMTCVNNYGWQITGNTLVNNTNLSPYSGGAITCGSLGTISNNLIYGNQGAYGGGIYVNDCRSSGVVSNNVIANNYATNSGGGIYFSTSNFANPTIQVKYNHIIDNRSANTCGMNFPSPTNAKTMYNTITRNRSFGTSIVQQAIQANPQSSTGTRFTHNNLYSNSGTGTFYEFYNSLPQSNGTVFADTCWWGTTTTSLIDATIFDFFDDGTLAITDYTPIKTSADTIAPVPPVTNVIKTDLGGGNIQLSWNASPATDVAGYKIYWGNATGYSYSNNTNAGNVLNFTISATIGDTIAVTAYDNLADGNSDQLEGNESWYTRAIGKPQISFSASPLTLCAGNPVAYTDSTIDAASWSWSFQGGNPPVSSSQNPVVLYNSGGTYDVTLVISNIAGSDTLVKTGYITVNTMPVVTFTGLDTICNTDPVFTLTGGSPAGGTYSGPAVSGNTFDPSQFFSGSYILTYTYVDSNGCGTAQAQETIDIENCTSLNEIAGAGNIRIMPNPSNGNFILNFGAATTFATHAELYTMAGQLIYSAAIPEGKTQTAISVQNIEAGIYFLRFGTEVIRVSIID
jgi:PKD repeat protein